MRPWFPVLLAACGFRAHTPSDEPGDATTDALDAPAPDAFVAHCSTDPGLRACYLFDGDLLDHTANHNDIAATGTAFGPGHTGQAVIDSAGDTMLVAASESLNVSDVTISMWIDPTTIPVDPNRAGLLDSGGRYRVFLQPGGLIRFAITNGPQLYTTASNAVVTGKWTHVVATYDRTTMTIYIDGTVAATLAQAGFIPQVIGGMVIGHNNPSGENFDGALDEVQLFGSIVTPASTAPSDRPRR